MKISKAMLPALAMLILTAVMLSTASYAWFAMGSEVSANNMNVSVKSDSTYLVILKELEDGVNVEDVEGITKVKSGVTSQSVDFNATNKELYPVAFGTYTSSTVDDKTTYTKTAAYATVTNLDANDVWYTMQSAAANSSVGADGTLKPVTNTELLTDYALVNTVYVAVSRGSNEMKNLKAQLVFNGEAEEAINVVVAVVTRDDGGNIASMKYQRFQSTDKNTYGIPLADSVTETPIEVRIYVYYDGEHNEITTNNLGLGNIKNASVNVKFTADPVA